MKVHNFADYIKNSVSVNKLSVIIAPQKFDALKTNICPRSEALRANVLVLRMSNFQVATTRPEVLRHKWFIVFFVYH